MVFTNKHAKLLVEKFPDFAKSKSLVETHELFSETVDECNVYTLFIALSHYMVDEVMLPNKEITDFERELYEFLEESKTAYQLYPEGTDEREFDNALCTCFLENLINRASAEKTPTLYDRFIPLLGPSCKEFCKAWDKFTGVRSPGLWTDDEWIQAEQQDKN